MNKSIIGLAVAPLLFGSLNLNAQEHPKAATSFTQKVNEQVYKTLDFSDNKDWEDAKRGFIVTVDSGLVYNEQGKLVVRESDYDFIKGKAPASVNPALWRHAQINDLNGLFKITDGIYQVRSIDIANIGFIET